MCNLYLIISGTTQSDGAVTEHLWSTVYLLDDNGDMVKKNC